jgi:peptidoglycan-N-acetylglucosamine deacetylase
MTAQKGHAIGNHSWDHSSFPLLNSSERRMQIKRCENAIVPYGQNLFRPPYGHQSFISRLDAFLLGYKVVAWNIMAEDWLDHDAKWLAEKVGASLRAGSIVLFHDSLYTFAQDRYINREPTLEAVSMLLERFSDKFSFVTVPQLLKQGKAHRQNWYQKETRQWVEKLKVETIKL